MRRSPFFIVYDQTDERPFDPFSDSMRILGPTKCTVEWGRADQFWHWETTPEEVSVALGVIFLFTFLALAPDDR